VLLKKTSPQEAKSRKITVLNIMKRTAFYLAISGALLLFCLLFVRKQNESIGQNEKPRADPLTTTQSAPKSSESFAESETAATKSRSLDSHKDDRQQVEAFVAEFARIFSHRTPSEEEIEAFLDSKGRTSETLLAAALTSRENSGSYLHEALTQDPDNPLLLAHAAGIDTFPLEDRLQWSEQLMEKSPDDAFAAATHAMLLIKVGKRSEAIEALIAATERPDWADYAQEAAEVRSQLYQFLGYSPLAADFKSEIVTLTNRQEALANELLTLQNQWVDATEYQKEELRILTTHFGQRLIERSHSSNLVNAHIGGMMQRESLNNLAIEDASSFEGLSVGQAQIHVQKESDTMRNTTTENALMNILSPIIQDKEAARVPETITMELLRGYVDRIKNDGERSALLWANEQMK
jgi:tetratricopeptide (TPR) repeat protein